MINFGVYTNFISDGDLLNFIVNEINRGFNDKEIIDASIFYDQIGSIKTNIPCGIFHSSDLWNFSGNLLVLSITDVEKILNIANDINLFFGYGWGERNVLSILKAVIENNIETICASPELAKDFYRITGKSSIGITNDLQNAITMTVNGKNNE